MLNHDEWCSVVWRPEDHRHPTKFFVPCPLRTEISPVSLKLLMMLCTVDDEICKAFAIWHWGTLFLKYSTIFLHTLSQIGEPLPIFTSERLCLSNCAFTPDATCANKSRYSRVVGTLEHFEFTRFIRTWHSLHSRVKFTSQETQIRVMGGASATVISTGNGGALNTTGILVFLIYFVLCDQQTNKN